MSFNSVTGFLSGGVIDPSTPNYAGAASKAEQRRQNVINQGMSNINAVFGGGQAPPTYSVASGTFNPLGQYYKQNAKLGTYALTKPSAKLFKKGQLFSQTPGQTFSGFQPSFYNDISKNYINYALPQLSDQYNSTKNSIMFGLQNRGLQGSGAMDTALSDLNVATGRQEQGIADTARKSAQDVQMQVENARQAAIDQLYQTADPSQALQRSVSSAAQFRVPQTFTPLLNAFSSIANQYAANQLYNTYLPPQYINPYSSGRQALGPDTY